MPILFGLLVAVALVVILAFNSVVARKNEVKNALATIDAMLKKRFDLIPNLVAAAKESMKFETSTLEKVIQLRSQVGAGSLTPEKAAAIDRETGAALKSFFVQVEAYPDLKSTQSIVQMQNALQEIEDQLAAARRTYNAAVTNYNNSLEMFPTSMVASMMGLRSEELFHATETEKQNVNVAQLFKG
jgi:LemA protein